MTTTYATTADLQLLLDGSDGGSGTPAQLSPAQLQKAILFGSNRVSVFAGNVYDSSTPQAVPPDIFSDLTLSIAAFFAYTFYLKSKAFGPQHPVMVAYTEAMKILNDVRDGVMTLDVVPPGGVGNDAQGTVINRIPRIFTGENSGTRFDPLTGVQEPELPGIMGANWAGLADTGFEYQG